MDNHRVEAMRRKPWHWPNHLSLFPLTAGNVSLNIKAQKQQGNGISGSGGGYSVQKSYVGFDLLDWKDFVNRPLFLEKDEEGEATSGVEDLKLCQKGYAPNTVSPCRGSINYVPKPLRSIPKAFLRHLPCDTHNPIYEHNPVDGRPFENLLQLRAAKVRNFLSLPERWEMAGIGFLQYDSLLGNGLPSLTEEIGRTLGIPNSCPTLVPFEKSSYNISNDFRDWITEAAEWDVERLIGFRQRPMP